MVRKMEIKPVEEFRSLSWRVNRSGQEYLISTSNELLDRHFINEAFNTKEMYWAKPLDSATMEIMISQSLSLGLYKVLPTATPPKSVTSPSCPRTPSPTLATHDDERLQQIGIARMITDYVTVVYLTDVYVKPEYQGLGLGKWILACCKLVMQELPYLRRLMFITSPVKGKAFYEREMGCHDIQEDSKTTIAMTRGPWKKD